MLHSDRPSGPCTTNCVLFALSALLGHFWAKKELVAAARSSRRGFLGAHKSRGPQKGEQVLHAETPVSPQSDANLQIYCPPHGDPALTAFSESLKNPDESRLNRISALVQAPSREERVRAVLTVGAKTREKLLKRVVNFASFQSPFWPCSRRQLSSAQTAQQKIPIRNAKNFQIPNSPPTPPRKRGVLATTGVMQNSSHEFQISLPRDGTSG